jgi:peptide/nickel transport system substrate-binding protein
MRKKNLILALSLIALTSLIIPIQNVVLGSPAAPKNPYELIRDRLTGAAPHTLDSHLSYDGPSGELIQNVYEGLIDWEGEAFNVFVPKLATQVWVAPPDPSSPPYTNFTIYFKIRVGAPFQNWSRTDMPFTFNQYYLTTDDVQYSFYRDMVHDYVGGAQWMIWDPLLRCAGANASDPTFGTKIQNAVGKNATYVWFNIANPGLAPATGPASFTPVKLFATEGGRMSGTFWTDISKLPTGYPLNIILQVIGEPWFRILCKQWIIDFVNTHLPTLADGNPADWNGSFAIWTDYTGWGTSPLDKISSGTGTPGVTCGTGPYILDRYDTVAEEWSVVKFDAYWGGWPASYPNPPYAPEPSSGIKPVGYVTRLTVRCRPEAIALSEFISGDCDWADVTVPVQSQLHVNGDRSGPTLPGIRLDYPTFFIGMDGFYPTFVVDPTPTNTYGKIYPNDTLAEDGIPSNFFNDIHVRRAFYQLINYTVIIQDYYLGEAYQPVTCAPFGLAYVNPNQPYWTMNITAAISEFNLAFGGNLNKTGFTVNLYYYLGSGWGEKVCDNLAANINSVGVSTYSGKFHAVSKGLAWPDLYDAWLVYGMPAWIMDWGNDFADVQNDVEPFMGTTGAYPVFQRYSNSTVDALISKGLATPEGPQRQAIYYELEQIYYDQAVGASVAVPIFREYSRTWVAGWFYNVLYGGMRFGYNMWKWDYLNGNVNFDNKVDMADIVAILDSFGSYVGKGGIPSLQARWNFYCDVIGNPYSGWRDRKIDMYDVTQACDNFGKTQAVWTPP